MLCCLGRRREQELVIVSRGSQAWEDIGAALQDFSSHRRQRQPRYLHDGGCSGCLADVAEIGDEAVGHVDHSPRGTAQTGTELGARFGQAEAPDQIVPLWRREFEMGATQYTKLLPWLYLYGYRRLVGIDLVTPQDVVEGPIQSYRMDLTKTSFKDGAFGAIGCLSVIEHGVSFDA